MVCRCTTLVLLIAGPSLLNGCGATEPDDRQNTTTSVVAVETGTGETLAPPRGSLAPGERFSLPACDGWINGPPDLRGPGLRLIVVDLWGDWCPFCADTVPALVECHRRYSGSGVSFLSVTGDDESTVRGLVERFSVPWPHGYGVATDDIRDLGVLNDEMPGAWYAVKPTLYLLNQDLEVLWCDGQMRMAHEAPEATVAALEQAIEIHSLEFSSTGAED